jgi:hypothetical protein
VDNEAGTPIKRRSVLAGLGAAAAGAAAPSVLGQSAAWAATPVKFRPGHYAWVPTLYWTPERATGTYNFINSIASNPYIKGIVLHLNWAYYEGAQGDYSGGFAIVDEVLRRLPANKHLLVQVAERSFGNPTTNVYPPYVINNGWVAVKPSTETWSGNLQSVSKMWQANVMDRLIALSRAYAARYDGNPRFAMFGLGETALGPPAASTGFDSAAFLNQWKRWFTESKKVWTRTPVRLCANFTRTDADMLSLFDHVITTVVPGGAAVGGPDPELPLPDITRTIQANRLFRGEPPATRDLRTMVPWVGEVQQLGLGTRYEETPAEIFDYYYNVMHASYMIWLVNTSVGSDAARWPAILDYINSIKGKIHTTLPTVGTWELG